MTVDRDLDLVLVPEPGGAPDPEAQALVAGLALRTGVSSAVETVARARAALVRAPGHGALGVCRQAATPALVLGGGGVPGGEAVSSRADVAEWVRALGGDTGAWAAASARSAAAGDPTTPVGLPRPGALPLRGEVPAPADEQRRQLLVHPPSARTPYRVLHIGTYVFGETDVVRRILQALRTLGHEVAAVDPRVVPGLHDGSPVDGVQPHRLDVRAIRPLVERFRPDVVLWNAGGFHPSVEGARMLRERGIAQIHLVLSDPDAHDNTLEFADRFDLVATNARSCVTGYSERGVPIVRHLPFAVDWSFVVAPVRPRPEWRADVVCVGQGRPDRQEPMKHLAALFDVRVFGERWDLPAVAARGEDVVSALREGTFHVNFPRTKAGFTNVKVGVFESVAQGGILCTEMFDEMGALFAYDREIVGYENIDQLAAAISYLKRHPEELDEIRRRGLARLAGEHLWEHRLGALFDALEDAGRLRPRPAPRPARFVVLGYWGMRNAGDDLILRQTADELERRFPGAVVRGIGFDRGRLLVEEGFDGVGVTDVFEGEDHIREADALLFGGGGLVHDLSFRLAGGIPDLFDNFGAGPAGLGKFLLLARIHGIPVLWHALGAGPIDTSDARALVQFLAEGATAITVRDDDSAASLAACGPEATVAADPTYLVPRPGSEELQRLLSSHGLRPDEYCFVSLRQFAGADPEFEPRLARALETFAAGCGLRIVFVPFQRASGSGDDSQVHERVAARLTLPALCLPGTISLEEVVGAVAGARCGLSMRLHGSILANSFGVPTVGLAYDAKVRAHFRSLGVEELVFPLDAEPERVAGALLDVARDPRAWAARTSQAIEAARARARVPFDLVERALADAGSRRSERQVYVRRYSLREHEFAEVRRQRRDQIRQLRAEVRTLTRELKQARREAGAAQRRLARLSGHPAMRAARAVRRLVPRRRAPDRPNRGSGGGYE